jgi:nucleotide-binding universal stress UspA family protein
VLEYLNGIRGRLPASVTPTLGPDATGLGWVYQYALEDTTGRLDLAQLRGVQDWYLRYALTAVPGVSEVASVGGFEKQYQVDIDPAKLLAYGIPVTRVMSDIQSANADVGAMTMELSEREYMVRGLGYLRSIGDIENVVVGATAAGTPIRVAELGLVAPDASVTLAHAWPGVPAVAPALTGWEQAYERALPELFERARREIGAPETMQVETVTLTGRSPGRAVAGFAAAAGADLVVSATHGHGFVARLVLGSVAAELLRGAPCSFLCVPGSATTHAAARETVPSTA